MNRKDDPKTSTERARVFRLRREGEGKARLCVWIPADTLVEIDRVGDQLGTGRAGVVEAAVAVLANRGRKRRRR